MIALALAIAASHDATGEPPVATANDPVVIVHGAWGGAHHWKAVDDSLTRDHHRLVRRVSLTGLGERSHLASKDVGLKTHIQDVVNAIEYDDLHSVVLIAHSYGGVVASGVVDAIPDRIKQVIYLDAHVLNDGECYLSHHPEKRTHLIDRANADGNGWLIPVDWENSFRDTPHPLATLVEPLTLTRDNPKSVDSSYWLLADGKPAEQDERFRYYQRAIKRGWATKVLPWNHNPQRDRPKELVKEIVAVITK